MVRKQFSKISTLIFISLSVYLLSSCTSMNSQQIPPGYTNRYSQTANHYLELAKQAQAPQKQTYELQAAGRMLQERMPQQAKAVLDQIDTQQLPANLQIEKQILDANYALLTQHSSEALTTVKSIPSIDQQNNKIQTAYYEIAALAYLQQGDPLHSAHMRMSLAPLLKDPAAQKRNKQLIWNDLQKLPKQELNERMHEAAHGDSSGWLELAFIEKSYKQDPKVLNSELRMWRQRYPQHPANSLLPSKTKYSRWNNTQSINQAADKPSQIALLVPLSGKLGNSGKMINDGFMAGYYDKQQDSDQQVKVYNTSGKNIRAVYDQAVADGAKLVVGPLTKTNVSQLANQGKLPVPTLALNYVPNQKLNSNLYQYALSPQDEARQVADHAWQDRHSRAIVIVPDNDWGKGIADTFTRRWESLGGKVVDNINYTNKTNMSNSIKKALDVNKSISRKNTVSKMVGEKVASVPRRREDIDIVFLVASPVKARQIRPLFKFYYAADLPIYTTSQVYAGTPNPMRDKDLNGIKFCDSPWAFKKDENVLQAQKDMHEIAPNATSQMSRLYAFGLDAYNLSTQLNHLSMYPDFGINGMTGTLYLGQDHRVLRRLEWAQFKEGVPEVS